jgi:hypothetical protein
MVGVEGLCFEEGELLAVVVEETKDFGLALGLGLLFGHGFGVSI